jgi:uncharacterized protein (DUF2252 family)
VTQPSTVDVEKIHAVAPATPGKRRYRPDTGVRLTPAERAARGKAARAEVPRSAHAVWEPPDHRPDPVSLLLDQDATRVAELVPVRYGRMLISPFTFYRGAAAVMASDLASTPRSGLITQICGDAHLSNFGAFASPERRLVFDVNDFDETLPGPWEWDVKRLGTSLMVAGRDNGHDEAERAAVVMAMVRRYRDTMRTFAGMANLDVWYAHLPVDAIIDSIRDQVDPEALRRVERTAQKAQTHDSHQAMSKLTVMVDGEPRFASRPPLLTPVEELLPDAQHEQLHAALTRVLSTYRRTLPADRRALLAQYRAVHLARKVVGVGSVGLRAYVALLMGRDGKDPLFLQLKEAESSVLEGHLAPSEYVNHGQRVVVGQHMMQGVSDIFLGWERIKGLQDGRDRDFYVRQLRDWKMSIAPEALTPAGMAVYGEACAWTLARAHARSGDRIAISSYLGTGDQFDRAITAFSERYADQSERDFASLQEAAKDGRVQPWTPD